MIAVEESELICLSLSRFEDLDEDTVAPKGISVPGLAAVLDIDDERLAERIALLDALVELTEAGLVEERTSQVAGLDGERHIYVLTEAGREHARALRDRVRGKHIWIDDGTTRHEVSIENVDEYVPETPLATVLANLSDDDVLYLETESQAEFVGRASAIESLRSQLEEVSDGAHRTVFLSGESGAGKTTLLERLAEIATDHGFQVQIGRCRQDATDPYGPFTELFDEISPAHQPTLLTDGGTLVEESGTLDATLATLYQEVASTMEKHAADRPLLLCLDDLQWAGRAMLDLLTAIVDTHAPAPVLVVGTYRPEAITGGHRLADVFQSLDGHARVNQFELQSFDVDATRSLLEVQFETRGVPASFAEGIAEHTGGNPLCIVEMATDLLSSGAVDPDAELYPDNLEPAHVPEAVQTSIERRLASLDDDSRSLLQTAAVVGDRVPLALLQELTTLPEAQLQDYVDVLAANRLWHRDGQNRALTFDSQVVRQTVLDSLDEPTRQELNRRVAEGLTRVFDDDIDAWAGSIAEHYAAADELTQALPYHVRAAEHARAEYAHVDAVSHYEDAIECARALSNHDDEILELLEEIGYVNYLVGEIDEAEKHFQYIRERTDESSILQRIARYESSMYADRGEFDRAHECAKRGLSLAGDEQSAETCELFGELGFALLHRGELETAIETFETMSSLAEQLDNTVLAGRALHYLGTAQIRLGDAESAIEQLEAAVETLEDTDEDRKLARSLSNLGIIYWKAGQLGRARELIERAIDLHTRVEDPINHAKTLTNHGILLFFQCLWSEAIERFEESIELSRPLGDKQNVANALGNISFCHERQGDFEAAMEYLTRSIDTYDTIDNDSDDIGTLHAHAARLYYFRDELETARDHAEIALEKAAEQAASEAESEAFRQLGTICRVTGEPKRAIEHHARGIRAAKEGALPALELECRCCLARDLVEVGRADGAVDQLEPVLESSEDVPLQPLLLVKAHRIRGECYRVMGEFDRATEASLTALDQARSLGSVHEEALVRYELGRLARDQAAPHDAREEFRKAASLCPDTGAALLKRRLRSALTTVQKRD